MTTAQLNRLCKIWKERLRVTDWTTSICWATDEEIPDCVGSTIYDPRSMTAEIKIRSGDDEAYLDGGIEQTIIHELLHIVMHGDVEYEKENIMQERAINQIADALYWSYHRPKSRKVKQ